MMALVKILDISQSIVNKQGICFLINIMSTEWYVNVWFGGTKRYRDSSQQAKARLQLRIYPFVTSLCEVHSSRGVGLNPMSLSALGDRASSGTVFFFSGQNKLVCSVGCRLLMDYCGYSSINWSHCVEFVV